MLKKLLCLATAALLVGLCLTRARSEAEGRPEPHRSPMDVAVLPEGRLALTANHSSDSVSLIDLEAAKVIAERSCGRKPAGVACSRDGRRAAVSNLWSGTVTLFDVTATDLRTVAEAKVGHLPRALVFSADGASVFVAVSGANEVVQLDWATRKALRHFAAPVEPRHVALGRDGRFLAAASARSAQVRCWDLSSGKLAWERTLSDGFNLHGLAFTPDDKELIATHCHDHHHSLTKSNIENSWALDSRLARFTLKPDPGTDYWLLALDERGRAIGDPCGLAFSTKGEWLAAAAAGTQELLVFRSSAIPWNGGEPSDFIDGRLTLGNGKYRRVPLGGRPLAVAFADPNRAVVANYLLDCVQIVDARAGKVMGTVALGGPAKPGLARQGEAIFYDARRSHHQWFSCHTCHTDGHTNGHLFDTLNDDSYGNPKLTPTLRGVTKTGPWTWHGWQESLDDAIEKSLTDTLFGPTPSANDLAAMRAFLETLDHPPNPNRGKDGSLTQTAARGKTLFAGKARCARCHQGANYTSKHNYDVKLEPDGSPFDNWNPPSLRGLCDRGPYLHDAKAETLDELLRVYHSPEKLGGTSLTPEERRDLIAFLQSL